MPALQNSFPIDTVSISDTHYTLTSLEFYCAILRRVAQEKLPKQHFRRRLTIWPSRLLSNLPPLPLPVEADP
jgi:hypothetical protein